MAGLKLKNISKSYDGKKVLDDVTLELSEGELLVLLGPSGCGKSTLLRIVAGLEKADSGEIYISDKRVDEKPPKDRNVALVFQNYALYPHMSVEKNLAFPLVVARENKSRRREKILKVAEILGLTDKLSKRPGTLSGGERQRVALGRAIIREPALFLLDEPLSNLDAELRTRMRGEIVRLQRRLKKTMIHVTHDQSEALTMADRIALINKGQMVQTGSPRELYNNPVNLFAASFVGQPSINLVNITMEDKRLSPFNITASERGIADDYNEVVMGLRPEAIKIAADGEYEAEIISLEYLGGQNLIQLKFKEIILTASDFEHDIAPGDRVRFSISPSDFHLFDAKTSLRITH